MKRNGAHSWQLEQVSRKRYILCIMVTLGTVSWQICESWLDETCTQLRQVHWKSVFFVFFPPKIYGEQKATLCCSNNDSAHFPCVSWCLFPCVHETELCIFLTINTFVSDKRWFLCIAWTCKQFDHLESTLDFKSSVQKALNNNKTMLFDVRFAFLMCIRTELDCCMT